MTLVILRHPEPGEPTRAQKESGRYRKRRMEWNGLTICVENEAGTYRRGRAASGHEWETLLLWAYGYVSGSRGVDGDEVDVYVGPHMEDAPMVYVVHQRCYGDWERYDEDKCMLGFMSADDAVAAFLNCYNDPRFLGPVDAIPVEQFVRKVRETKAGPGPITADPMLLLLG